MTRIRWKFIIMIDTLAVFISLTSGLLGGVSFDVLMVRILLGVAVFSILAIGLNILAVTVFPEALIPGVNGTDDDEKLGTQLDVFAGDESDNGALPFLETGGDSVAFEMKDSVESRTDASNGVDDTLPARQSNALTETITNEFDPKVMAKAVHTVMNKDGKG